MTTPLDKERLAKLRKLWEVTPGYVSQAMGLEMLDTIDALLRVKEAAEKLAKSGVRAEYPGDFTDLEEALQSLNRVEEEK